MPRYKAKEKAPQSGEGTIGLLEKHVEVTRVDTRQPLKGDLAYAFAVFKSGMHALSVNLRLAFAIERCLSRMSCVGVRAAGKSITMPIASLCFGGPRGWFLRLGGPHREEKRRGGW